MAPWRREDGTLAVEAAIVAPVLLLLMLLVVYAGRAAQTDADVRSAAARAARAASMTGDVASAETAASEIAAANLATAGIAPQVVPGMRWSVSATAAAPQERFIPQGDR